MTIFLDTSRVSLLHLFLHEEGQNVPTYTNLYGSTCNQVVEVPPSFVKDDHFVDQTYVVTTSVVGVQPTKELPCRMDAEEEVEGDESSSLMDCISSSFEKAEGCILPWRWREGMTKNCSGEEQLGRYMGIFYHVNDFGAKGVYDRTGCFYSCSYQVEKGLDM